MHATLRELNRKTAKSFQNKQQNLQEIAQKVTNLEFRPIENRCNSLRFGKTKKIEQICDKL